jgi:hypothetical protein
MRNLCGSEEFAKLPGICGFFWRELAPLSRALSSPVRVSRLLGASYVPIDLYLLPNWGFVKDGRRAATGPSSRQ